MQREGFSITDFPVEIILMIVERLNPHVTKNFFKAAMTNSSFLGNFILKGEECSVCKGECKTGGLHHVYIKQRRLYRSLRTTRCAFQTSTKVQSHYFFIQDETNSQRNYIKRLESEDGTWFENFQDGKLVETEGVLYDCIRSEKILVPHDYLMYFLGTDIEESENEGSHFGLSSGVSAVTTRPKTGILSTMFPIRIRCF